MDHELKARLGYVARSHLKQQQKSMNLLVNRSRSLCCSYCIFFFFLELGGLNKSFTHCSLHSTVSLVNITVDVNPYQLGRLCEGI